MRSEKQGFTLLEITIVVIIGAILAAVGIPKYTGAVEKSRASEGTYILGTLLAAQERYFLEKGVFASNLSDLDVEIPTPKNFNVPTVNSGCSTASECAAITRNTGSYALWIDRDGDISCSCINSVPACTQAGF